MYRYLYDWIIPRKLSQNDLTQSSVRAAFGRLEGWISIIVNFLLFAFKLIIGLLINSIALIADSIHSLSDVLTSVIVIIGYRISEKPADSEHPFGHQRAEYIATLIISILLAVAGIEFIKTAYSRLIHPQMGEVTIGVLGFILMTILIKAWLGAFSRYIGKMINSRALIADAIHHLTDSISSILVMIAIAGVHYGYTFLDGMGGMAVGIILIWAGFRIAKDAADSLLGKPPAPELVAKIQEICLTIENVINTHDIVVHSYGEQKFISVHVEVDQKKSSILAHNIGDQVEHALSDYFNAYATVHVDPVDINSDDVRRAGEIVQHIISNSSEIRGFHDLRMVKKSGHYVVIFDLVPVNPVFKTCEDFKECRQLSDSLKVAFPGCEIRVIVDPVYIFN